MNTFHSIGYATLTFIFSLFGMVFLVPIEKLNKKEADNIFVMIIFVSFMIALSVFLITL